MRAIVGVQVVASGAVTVLGRPAGAVDLRSRIGYVTQAPSIYLDLSIEENLRYFAAILGAGPDRIAGAIDTVGLRGRERRPAGSLSGGERSRVSLASALLGDPEVLVLDEPTVGLDPVLRRDLWRTFHAAREEGTTLLVSSHVMDEAAACDELVLMRDGAVLDHTHARRAAPTDRRAGPRRRLPGRHRGGRAAGACVSAAATLATARRVLAQIRGDPRTIALLLLVPPALLVLLSFLFEHQEATFQRLGPPLCGLFPFIVMFLVTSIAMLRERTTGTLERLMTLPLGKADLLAGTALAFGALATLQAIVICGVGFLVLGLDSAHGAWLVGALAVLNALLGMALGLFASAFAQTEFQAVQFMPAFVLPQLLLCGLFVPRDEMAGWLEAISYAVPLTYAFDALARATSPAPPGGAWSRTSPSSWPSRSPRSASAR